MAKAKPDPPVDLWAQIDKHLAEIAVQEKVLPPGAFTVNDFQVTYQVGRSAAHYRIAKLLRAGKAIKHGTTGNQVYYTLAK